MYVVHIVLYKKPGDDDCGNDDGEEDYDDNEYSTRHGMDIAAPMHF